MDLTRLKTINDLKAVKTDEQRRHEELLLAFSRSQETTLRAFKSLVDYLERRTSKTEVVNQLREVGTPDAMKVVQALDELHETLRTHENTDLSEITEVMRSVLEEAKQIPKELPAMPEIEQIDYSEQFKSLTEAVQAVEQVVKAKELVAEAPVVNVAAPKVKVDAPDLTALQDGYKAIVKAVKGIVIPEAVFDTKPVEKLLKRIQKTLEELPVGGGGGGGGIASYVDTTGNVTQVQVTAGGKVPVELDQTAVLASLTAVEGYLASKYGGGKSAAVASLTTSGDNTIYTPTSGKAVRLHWFSAVTDPDDSSTTLIKLKIGSTEYYRFFGNMAHSEVFEGAANESVVVSLDANANVAVTIHYEEFTP